MDDAALDDHPLRIGARALAGALLTEVAVGVVAVALVATYGSVDPSRLGPVLGHAVGLGLGAAVALAVADGLLARRRPWLAVGLGLALSPLAALGGWHGLHLADTRRVTEATLAVSSVVVESLGRGADSGSRALVGVAVMGYLPAIVLRRRGRGVIEVAARSTCVLMCLVVVSDLLDPRAGEWPLGATLLLVLTRALALPAGLALGDAVGGALARAISGEERSRRAIRRQAGRRRRWSAAMLAAAVVAVWPFRDRVPAELRDVLRSRSRLSPADARLARAEDLIHRRSRRILPLDLGTKGASRTRSWRTRGGPQLLVGQRDVVMSVASTGVVEVPLHGQAVEQVLPLAERDDVDAMLLLVGLLFEGTQLDDAPASGRGWRPRYEATAGERAQALVWARRVIDLGPGLAPVRIGRGRRGIAPWINGGADPAAVVHALSPGEAVEFARVLVSRDPTRLDVLQDLLARHRGLRLPEDDTLLAAAPQAPGVVALELVEGLEPVLPRSVTPSASPAADALARRALASWTDDPAAARRLALAALAHDDDHVEACLVVAAWHLRAALGGEAQVGHVQVATQHLDVVERLAPLDPCFLTNVATCDVLMAMLTLNGGRAVAALHRLQLLAALDPATEVRDRLAATERVLRGWHLVDSVERVAILEEQLLAQLRALELARGAGASREVLARELAVDRLTTLIRAANEDD